MIHPPSAIEDPEKLKRKSLFSLLGIPWTVTSRSALFVPTRFVFGIILSTLFLRSRSPRERLSFGVIFAGLTLLTNIIHIVGYTISGRLVDAPMDENLITETSIFTVYHGDQSDIPPRIHLSRALGGPLANLLVGLVGLTFRPLFPGPALRFFTILNFAMGLGLLLPIPDADGEVIWRELSR